MHVKQSVQELLDRLPDDCSLDDVQYHLYVLQSIERGQADAQSRTDDIPPRGSPRASQEMVNHEDYHQ